MENFSNTDLTVFLGYLIFMIGFGIWLSRKKGENETAQDYFLASKALPWWAVGYVVGLAIASYELMAAVTLIIVAKYFLPIFLKKRIYTMPQFLEERFDKRVRTGMEKFDLILEKTNPEYINLPGISVLIRGMWIANLYYWGNNQYIIQRALAVGSEYNLRRRACEEVVHVIGKKHPHVLSLREVDVEMLNAFFSAGIICFK